MAVAHEHPEAAAAAGDKSPLEIKIALTWRHLPLPLYSAESKVWTPIQNCPKINSKQKMIHSKVKRCQLLLLLLFLGWILTLLNREPAVSEATTLSDSPSNSSPISQSPSFSQSPTPLSETDRFRGVMESRIKRIGKQCEILKHGWEWCLSNKTFQK